MTRILLLTFLVLMLSVSDAHAYIDPGSGSAIMAAIIGFFVAVGITVKSYWYKIKSIFSKNKSSADDSE